ncbi:MAG: LytTR family DNA-binding domain-containing protein [Bacteroidetes bacterium]|nr:LytTR family DNA-binding domain-containing protein [Bacteroidota bacterium]MDA1121649.1 LytTR family DNA-binding domain-containing protein [Bacteroidota bacterium]
MKINCLIVDDEPLARDGIAGYMSKIHFLSLIETCKNALEATEALKNNPIDLIFLDINMPGMSGLQLMKSLSHPPIVIFTTAYRDYAADGFDLNAIDYLVKPFSFERFTQGANKAYEYLLLRKNPELAPGTADEFFFVKCDGKFVKIYFDEILFIEGMKDYTIIYRGQEKLIVLVSLKKVEERLPSDSFLRVHKSYIAAKNKIGAIDGNQLKIGSHLIPISKNTRESVISEIVGDKLWRRA